MFSVYVMAACWLAFLAYWAIASVGVKKDLDRLGSVWISVGIRLGIVAVGILLFRLPATGPAVQAGVRRFALLDPVVEAIGAVLCVLGIGFAIWARAALGTNWSEFPAAKVGHVLVTNGPYRLVRHPIYSGMLLAMLGTALITGIPGLLVLLGFGVVAIRRIGVEERLMTQLFADDYLQYRKRTKALIPCVV